MSRSAAPKTAARRTTLHVSLQVEELESRIAPAALTPAQIRHAYGFDQVRFTVNGQSVVGDGAGQTIAIVSAYDHTRIFSDVDTFNKAFSIAAGKTIYQQYGAASTFLTKVNPQGTPGSDRTGGLWHLETALDVQWAHVVAPAAKVLLVQAKSSDYRDLFVAVDYARNQPGVVAVSMSWGSEEFVGESYYNQHFMTPAGHVGGSNGRGGPRLAGGVTFVAASGDDGAPGNWPAMSPFVVAVGGTRPNVDAAGNWRGEVAWTGSGGGPSIHETKPTYQSTVSGTKRSNPDVAYNGDPASGIYVYNTMPVNGKTGSWWQVGGTSAGAPQWAGLIAIANQGRALQGKGSLDGFTQTLPALYNLTASAFHDITQGSNGYPARSGFDLATGRGSPLAQRIIADLVRVDSRGQLTISPSSSSPSGSATPRAMKPLLYFVAVTFEENSSVTTITVVRVPDVVAVLVRSQGPGARSQEPEARDQGTRTCQTALILSPKGAAENSPGRKPWVADRIMESSPEGATETPCFPVLPPHPDFISEGGSLSGDLRPWLPAGAPSGLHPNEPDVQTPPFVHIDEWFAEIGPTPDDSVEVARQPTDWLTLMAMALLAAGGWVALNERSVPGGLQSPESRARPGLPRH